MIANLVTVSRIPFSLCLFFLSPSSVPFAVLYLLCGVSDVLDGFLARMLHTESTAGERLDSAADIVFALVYAAKLLPLMCLPVWIWIWTAAIAAAKIFAIIRAGGLNIAHSFANKLTGLLVFLLPMTVAFIDVKCSAAAVCAVATVTAAKELFMRKTQNNNK